MAQKRLWRRSKPFGRFNSKIAISQKPLQIGSLHLEIKIILVMSAICFTYLHVICRPLWFKMVAILLILKSKIYIFNHNFLNKESCNNQGIIFWFIVLLRLSKSIELKFWWSDFKNCLRYQRNLRNCCLRNWSSTVSYRLIFCCC